MRPPATGKLSSVIDQAAAAETSPQQEVAREAPDEVAWGARAEEPTLEELRERISAKRTEIQNAEQGASSQEHRDNLRQELEELEELEKKATKKNELHLLLKKHPRKTLWYISSNWTDRELVTVEDVGNLKHVLKINYELSFSEFSDDVVVGINLMHHPVIIITSQNQYLKKEITSEQQIMIDRYINLKMAINIMKGIYSGEDPEAPFPAGFYFSLLNLMTNRFAPAETETASSEISTREIISLVSKRLEIFKESLDPDLIKILNFIKDNPGIKNPEFQDCPLSQVRRAIASRLNRVHPTYRQHTITGEKRNRDKEGNSSSSSAKPHKRPRF
jgi:hypothetical protein